jgi:cardiolipin synthase A/B
MNVPEWATGAPTVVAILVVLSGIAVRVIALGVIPGGRKPSVGMAWLLAILLSPALGLAGFLLFGRSEVGRRRQRRQERVDAIVAERSRDLDIAPSHQLSGQPMLGGVVALNDNLGAFPLLAGNAVRLHESYGESMAAMAEAVRGATSYVHVEFYIAAWDDVTAPVLEACAKAAARGVTVRLLFDHLATRGTSGFADFCRRLTESDILWREMLPLHPFRGQFRRPDLRNHRKMLVVDGSIGFMGSQNLIEPGYGSKANHRAGRAYVDLMTSVTGPAVAALDAVFAGDWYQETGERLEVEVHDALPMPGAEWVTDVSLQVVPSGPGVRGERNLRMFTSLIHAATHRVSITSPYFVPDESLLYAVTTAALRGVDVELFVSEAADQFMVGHAQASYYSALLEAGVDIRLYPAPLLLHSKHFTVDDDVAVIGSSNMDLRSFALNYEVSMLMVGREVVERMRTVEDGYRVLSRHLTVEEWENRSPLTRYVDNVMRLTAGLQ